MTSTTNEAQRSDEEIIASISTSYDYGWHDSDAAGQSAKRGLDEQVVRDISAIKQEPQWMLERRLKAYEILRATHAHLGYRPIPARHGSGQVLCALH